MTRLIMVSLKNISYTYTCLDQIIIIKDSIQRPQANFLENFNFQISNFHIESLKVIVV